MAFRPLHWFFTNRYVHIRSFLQPILESDVTPAQLKGRLEGRLVSAIRLAKVRIFLYAIIYVSVVGTAGAAVLNWIAVHFGSRLFGFFGEVFAVAVWMVSFLVILALLVQILVTRALSLLEADIYVLSMEAVSRAVNAGAATLPSQLNVQSPQIRS